MKSVPVGDVGEFGVITDLNAHSLPLNAWSGAENMHPAPGYMEKVPGEVSVCGTPSVAPHFTTFVRSAAGVAFWIYAGSLAVYAYRMSTRVHSNITRAAGAYTAVGALSPWQGGIMNGIPILNNGADVPQMWNPVAAATLLVALSNWPATVRAQIIRPYKNYLVALDVTKAGVRDPRLVKWSHPASAGSVPSSWDETDATRDAGEYSIADTDGYLLDCLPLRNVNILYKDDSIWSMHNIAGPSIFSFTKLFQNAGVFGKDCAVEFISGQHLVLGREDVFTHDGVTMTSILTGRVRKNLYAAIDPTYAYRSFVALDKAHTEVWICYPLSGAISANRALIWNWVTKAIGYRDLPNVASIGIGSLEKDSLGTDTWATGTETWEDNAQPWSLSPSNPTLYQMLMASATGSNLLGVFDDEAGFSSVAFTASLERTGLGIPLKTGQLPDITAMKFCSNIWPRITGLAGGVVQVRLGSQISLNAPVVWGAWKDFTIGTTKKIDVLASGVLFAIGFRSTTLIDWQLHGYTLEAKVQGANL